MPQTPGGGTPGSKRATPAVTPPLSETDVEKTSGGDRGHRGVTHLSLKGYGPRVAS